MNAGTYYQCKIWCDTNYKTSTICLPLTNTPTYCDGNHVYQLSANTNSTYSTQEQQNCCQFSQLNCQQCVSGACVSNQSLSCSSDNYGQIIPSTITNKYSYCNPDTNTWTTLARNQEVRFNGFCTAETKAAILKDIAVIQDYAYPQMPLEIFCNGDGMGGGAVYGLEPGTIAAGIHDDLYLFCDPVKYPDECAATLTHEVAHKFEQNNPGLYEEFLSTVIGCEQSAEEPKYFEYHYEIAIDDDKYGPWIKWDGNVGISRLPCHEAWALANNHYVYNACYVKNNPKCSESN